jgi:tellurite resistance protein TerC
VFFGFITLLLFLDLGVFHKKDRVIGLGESLKMTVVYVVLGLLFGLWVWFKTGWPDAADYYTVYVLEKTLSLDNLFVMSVIFASFQIPRQYQHRVLFWGIIGVIILRGVMIASGAALMNEYHWVILVFAALLIYTGYKMVFLNTDDHQNFKEKWYVAFMVRYLRLTPDVDGNKFFTKKPIAPSSPAVWHATPLFLALCTIEITDVMFAFDSIPAALAITTDPYTVYTANIFAILGLRALFFAMEHVLHRFSYMKYALAIVLVFIGLKVFYNHFFDAHVSAPFSLAITLGVLAMGIVVSILKTRETKAKG